MTPVSHRAMKKELAQLIASRAQISQEIETARDHGDLKENAEYHAAKDKQGFTEARIAELEDRISRADVIDTTKLGGDRIKFGATVALEDVEAEREVTYRIVGADEADLADGTISVTSPVARALIGREVGDEVRVKVPSGTRVFEIADLRWE